VRHERIRRRGTGKKLVARPERRFYFRLALALGEIDVDGMLARVGSRQVSEWIEYAKLEPFGEERADLRSAIVAATLVNLWSKKKAKAEDFMPKFGVEQPKEPQDLEEMKRAMQRVAGIVG
jgi:hypothetical protein